MRAKEIASIVEEYAPLSFQEAWDNSGFCVGDPEQEVTGVLIALDCTPDLVEEAVQAGLNMIVTHHPLIFGGVKQITPDNSIGKTIIKAIKNDVVLYSAHTNADKTKDGVSWQVAEKLNLKNTKVLSPDFALEEGVGLGVVGELPASVDVHDFIDIVKHRLSLDCIRTSGLVDKAIYRVAICGGSGKSLIREAIKSGADVYISGDISYHDFFCEKGFMIFDIGHYESEIEIVKKINALIQKKLPNFAVRITSRNNNPIQYH